MVSSTQKGVTGRWSFTACVIAVLCALIPILMVSAQPGTGNVLTETHTETQRSLMGGFWKHSTSTTTTTAAPRIVSLNDIETGTLVFRTDEPGKYIEAVRVDTRAALDVTGMIARVVVTQSFVNPSDDWVGGYLCCFRYQKTLP